MKAEQTHTSMARNVFRNFRNISLKFPKRFPSFVECSLRVQEKSKQLPRKPLSTSNKYPVRPDTPKDWITKDNNYARLLARLLTFQKRKRFPSACNRHSESTL